MIITLVGADFSANKIGTLTTWAISPIMGEGATYDGVTSINRGDAFSATVTIADGYELGTAGVSVTMGGDEQSDAYSISDNKITISIASVTGTVVIRVPTKNVNTGEEDSGGSEPETPVNPPSGDEETNLTSQFTWTAGGVIWSDGKDREDSNWLRSNYVDIGDYTQLRFTQAQTTTTGTVLGYAFYDSSKTYISGDSNGGASSYAPIEKTIDVPSDAKYFRTMWMNTTNTNYDDSVNNISKFYCYGIGGSGSTTPTTYTFTVNPTPTSATVTLSASGYTTVSGAGSKSITVVDGTTVNWTVSASGYETQTGTQSVTSSSSKNVTLTESNSSGGGGTGAETDLTSQFSWTPGTNVAASGTTQTSDTNWLFSNTVDVSAYSQIRFAHIQTSNANTTLGYTFYDSSMAAVGNKTNGGTSYTPVDRTVDVPSNAKYFRCMWINTTSSNYDASIHDISKFYCYGID